MIEETLIQYGVLGAWTLTLLYRQSIGEKDRKTTQKNTDKLIENNTIALTKVYEVVKACPNSK